MYRDQSQHRKQNQPCSSKSGNTRLNGMVLNKYGKSANRFYEKGKENFVQCFNDYFGAPIPADVLEDVLFRFIYNIPDNELDNSVRICFHLEQAHWFYLDFYVSEIEDPNSFCKKVSYQHFVRQVFCKCEYFNKWRKSADTIVDEFRRYKSTVPTCGVIMLDSTLNYILLIQGYYAKSSWGFPKGKVNEGEIPRQCAIREALEEVGFDTTEYISDKVQPLKSFINDTPIQLYLATDIPMDFPFKPHMKKEIKKISWFSVRDLPKSRGDEASFARLGMQSNNFNTILPFINNILLYIKKEQADRNKLKHTILRNVDAHSISAFEPFVSKGINIDEDTNSNQVEIQYHDSEKIFRPVKSSPHSQKSFTGQSFIKLFSPDGRKSLETELVTNASEGVIRQPKPLHSRLILNVYEDKIFQNDKSVANNQSKCLAISNLNRDEEKISMAENDAKPTLPINIIQSRTYKETGEFFKEKDKTCLHETVVYQQEEISLTTIKIISPNLTNISESEQSNQPSKYLDMLKNLHCDIVKCNAWNSFVFVLPKVQQN